MAERAPAPAEGPAGTTAATPEIARLTLADLSAALRAGAADFVALPQFGLFFASVYVLGGIVLYWLGAGMFTWTLALSLGFPLVAPFAAVGLYEVSRRREQHQRIMWSGILAAVWAERGGQIPWIGAILVLIFLFWSFFAHMSFALFLGRMTLVNVSTSWEVFLSPTGLALMAFQFATGGLVALFTFAITAFSMPFLLDRPVDFVTAMLTSLRACLKNWKVMLVWAALIGVALIVSMLPAFLGLFVTLPVFGHATWHLYRRAFRFPGAQA